MRSRVLTIDGGSSSLRFAVYEADTTLGRRLDGKIDRIGLRGVNLVVSDPAGRPLGDYSVNVKETTMSVRRIVTAIVAGCAAIVMSAAPGLAAQATQTAHHAQAPKAKPADAMAAKCQAMMADQDKMMAEMKAADQRLDDLAAKMNAASGAEKADATAAVVNEMITQRRAMRDGMMKMQQEMMGHMTEHMQAGKDSMAACPMMKQMGSMK